MTLSPFAAPRAAFLNRSAVAVAAALLAGGVQAQSASGVTLYGLADVGITSTTGLKAGTVTQVASGIMEGSRWGMKGNEDLGGGYRAIFTLESRVELDTGASSNRPISGTQISDRFSDAKLLFPTLPAATQTALQPIVTQVAGLLANEYGVNVGTYGNRVFDRQAFVGLVTPVGAVLAGRMYTPAFETNATFDIMETQSGLSAGQIVAFPAVLEIRKSNALAYRAVLGGFSGSVMYALGDNGEAANDQSQMVGFNASYKTGMGLTVGVGYNAAKNELGQDSLKTSILGAAFESGSHKATVMAMKITDDNPAGFSAISGRLTAAGVPAATAMLVQNGFINAFKQDGDLLHLGYRYTSGAHSVAVAYNRFDDKRPADADVSSYGVAYTYALSKRTDLNAVWVHYDNRNLAQIAPGGNGYLGGVTASAGTDSTAVALGIRHRF